MCPFHFFLDLGLLSVNLNLLCCFEDVLDVLRVRLAPPRAGSRLESRDRLRRLSLVVVDPLYGGGCGVGVSGVVSVTLQICSITRRNINTLPTSDVPVATTTPPAKGVYRNPAPEPRLGLASTLRPDRRATQCPKDGLWQGSRQVGTRETPGTKVTKTTPLSYRRNRYTGPHQNHPPQNKGEHL